MTKNYILYAVVIMVFIALYFLKSYLESTDKIKKIYKYKRKDFFLTRAEHECYVALVTAVGENYYVFAQVHLSSILDHKVAGQNSGAAFAHINQKSVDFLLCDKDYISPRLAIELDDRSHERASRQERDREVERILQEAGLPLLRLENPGSFDPNDLLQKITTLLTVPTTDNRNTVT
jgi:very-short-patch-repair endonuclease